MHVLMVSIGWLMVATTTPPPRAPKTEEASLKKKRMRERESERAREREREREKELRRQSVRNERV
jgi:hypothetical protein